MIRINNIEKKFKSFYALKGITASFRLGQVIALIGPNGSGKTTLIKTILGLVKPDAGTVFFNGRSIANDVNYRDQIGYMPQIGRYPDNMTIQQVISMIRDIRPPRNHYDEELLHRFELPAICNKTMKSLSGGTTQKVSAALAFLFNPEVLILDEPTAGLDPLATEILKEKILKEKKKGKLILITSHVLTDLEEITSDVMYLQEGTVQFYCPLTELQELTNEVKLTRAVAQVMKYGFQSLQQPIQLRAI